MPSPPCTTGSLIPVGQKSRMASVAQGAPGSFPWRAPRATLHAYCSTGGEDIVIYLIYKDGEILVETDDIEFVKSYVSQNQECSVRDARTGKKVPVE